MFQLVVLGEAVLWPTGAEKAMDGFFDGLIR